jgi:hypothetical protein
MILLYTLLPAPARHQQSLCISIAGSLLQIKTHPSIDFSYLSTLSRKINADQAVIGESVNR